MELIISELPSSSCGKTICLNMIVKNEADIIVDTLQNLCSYINFAYWVICDTGSTDQTKEIICDFFKKKGIKGELVEVEWRDFAYNRTKAIECAFNKTDYLLIFDADDRVVGNFCLPKIMNKDCYDLKFGNNIGYYRPLLITNRKKWCFKGVLHEYLAGIDNMTNGTELIDGEYYINSGRFGNRNKNPNKYLDDANVLKNAFEKEMNDVENGDKGMACRYAFYCAQSYKDAGITANAIYWYKKVLELNNWSQEKYNACIMIGNLYKNMNDDDIAIRYWIKSAEYDNERIEGIVNAMECLRHKGENLMETLLYHKFKNYNKNISVKKLFIDTGKYNDLIEYNTSICANYVPGENPTGYDCCKKIILNNIIGDHLMKSTLSNLIFYKEFIEKDEDKLQLFYSFDKLSCNLYLKNGIIEQNIINMWEHLFLSCKLLLTNPSNFIFTPKQKCDVFISFTTCKRLDLFKQTIFSMLNHWNDIEKIDYWFCVDDNSSEEDRSQMKTLFPWINFYMKTKEEKGHRNSMNIIWNKLNEFKPTYWIHMEDDFLFYKKINYIELSINALKSPHCNNNNVKQILFNRNYGETIEDYKIVGHITNENNNEIVIHKHCDGAFNYSNCHYWPHYSFRPSLIDVKTILKLGNFDTKNTFFEMDYAKKWTDAGYTSAFFNCITNRHIGRLTKERHVKTIQNAYDLNNENQFENTNTNTDTNTDTIAAAIADTTAAAAAADTIAAAAADTIAAADTNKIKIINLERRADRKADTILKLNNAKILSEEYNFIKAIDGNEIQPTIELKKLFFQNDFGNKKGVIGCALSHLNLWKELLDDNENNYYIIMEDDFTLSPNFKEQIETLKTNNEFSKRDVLFLGYHMFEKNRETHFHKYNSDSNTINIERLDCNLYIGGYFCYSINKNGAKILIDYIEKNGIKHGIDYLNKIIPNLMSYECHPQLVFSVWNENGKLIDSDIQNKYDAIDFTNISFENNIYINGISGLGNNLFQIATAIYYKETYKNKNINIILNKSSECLNYGTGNKFGRNKNKTSYFNTILNKFDTTNVIPSYCTNEVYNDCLTLNKIDLTNSEEINLLISGYCQNVELFFDIREKLCDYFNFNDELINQTLSEKYKIDNSAINIMLGIRIGIDGSYKYSSFTKQTYSQVINSIVENNNDKKINIYILSDVEEFSCMIDLSDKYNVIYVDEDDINQIYVGLMCNYFILSDSTYHWWIAFLKWTKDNSTIVYVFNDTMITTRCLLNNTLENTWKRVDIIPDDSFIYMKNVDHFGDDILYKNASVPILMENAKKITDCVCFNTTGFFKNKIDITNLQPSPYFKHCDGLYIKKEYYDKYINSSLQDIAEYFILDKCNKYGHNYIPIYEKYLSKKRNSTKNVFEIGIGCIEQNQMSHMIKYNYKNGNSLRAWKSYFKNANIWGIDIFQESLFEEQRIKTFVCDQSNPSQLQDLMSKINVKMDFISDDGSHIIEHQVIAFMELEKYLTDDGIYIIEDIWNFNFYKWKKLSCFPPEYINYIKLNYDVFYHDQSNEKSNCVDCMCVFKKKESIRIKMLCNWTNSEQLCKEWSNMCENNLKWKHYKLVSTNVKEDIDYYVIINSPPKDAYYEPSKTIVFQMEPWVNDSTKNWGVKTWGNWAQPNPSDFLEVRGRKTEHHNNAFWQLEITMNEMNNSKLFEKNKGSIISSICSSKYFDEGHIARIDFLKFLEAKGDVQLDIWNQDNNHNFTNYRGPLSPYIDKSNGIKPYKYYFMVENNYERNFITEKLWEPILCETLVFYYGCPNITDYIDSRAFVLLDMNDFEKSYQIIKQAIEEDWWSQRIEIIREEKQKILNKLAFFPTVENIIIKNTNLELYNKYFKEYNINNNNSSSDNPKKYCFIHSCYIKNIGINVLNKIINTLINSNSIQYFEKIFIVNIGEKLNPNDLLYIDLLQNECIYNESIYNKIHIINFSDNIKLFEFPTINLIHTFSEINDNCEILYLHTKGLTHDNNKKITDWINMMLYFLVNKCTECFELLKKYDTVGCNYTPLYQKFTKHYSGNFWWANSNYIKRLHKIPYHHQRHDAEMWILSDDLVNSADIHNSKINHYSFEYPPEKYI